MQELSVKISMRLWPSWGWAPQAVGVVVVKMFMVIGVSGDEVGDALRPRQGALAMLHRFGLGVC